MVRPIRMFAAFALLVLPVANAQAIDVFTDDGMGLDGEWTENLNGGVVSYGFNATKVDMNARYNGYNGGLPAGDTGEGSDGDDDNRNEFWVLRFDLTGVDKSSIGNIELKLTAVRDGENNRKDLRIWGVNPGAAGFNTFDETTTADMVPGFTMDSDMTTQSVDDSATTFLGDFLFPLIDHGNGEENPIAGDFLNINQDLLENSGPNTTTAEDQGAGGSAVEGTLQSYVRSLGLNDMAVFIVGGISSNGQVRVGTEEASDFFIGDLLIDPSPIFRYEIVASAAGDFDGDSDVDGADFLAWQKGYPGTFTAGDLADWQGNYGTGTAVAAVGAVPEPAAVVLALGGVLMLAATRARRASGR